MRFAVGFGLGLIMLVLAANVWAVPKLDVDHYEYNFGEIYQGENVKHTFPFTNQGDSLLSVEKVRSSCGCTAALVSSRELQPGETGEIQANFDSTRFRGLVAKTIYLYTNDTTQPVAQLFIRGRIKPAVDVNPHQVKFGSITAGVPVEATVTIVNQSPQTLLMEAPNTTAKELTAQLGQLQLEPGQQATLQVVLKAKPGQPRFSGYVLISTSGTTATELRIPVYATINP